MGGLSLLHKCWSHKVICTSGSGGQRQEVGRGTSQSPPAHVWREVSFKWQKEDQLQSYIALLLDSFTMKWKKVHSSITLPYISTLPNTVTSINNFLTRKSIREASHGIDLILIQWWTSFSWNCCSSCCCSCWSWCCSCWSWWCCCCCWVCLTTT